MIQKLRPAPVPVCPVCGIAVIQTSRRQQYSAQRREELKIEN
jgi:hypothetical protein